MTRHSLLRQSLTVLAVAALLLSVSGRALANTELVPAARLIAPFFDISEGRDTFLILANVSRWVHLDGTTFTCGRAFSETCGPFGVHLEFYGQSCARLDTNMFLSPGDIDVTDLRLNPATSGGSLPGGPLGPVTASPTQSGRGGRGWVDIDVRFAAGGGPTTADPGVAANVLMGTVLIVDTVTDVAAAYPMASGIGFSANGLLGRVVRRNASGRAVEWRGYYEPFPSRLFVPAFFAEFNTSRIARSIHGVFLALAAPADGNWDAGGNGEAPGQQIGSPGSPGEPLINVNALSFDGCEHSVSSFFSSHYVNNFLSSLMPVIPPRAVWTDANCGAGEAGNAGTYPGRDQHSNIENGGQPGQPVGWIDLQNLALACDNTTPGAGASNCPAYSFASTATTLHAPGVGNGQRRGMVGVLLEGDGFRLPGLGGFRAPQTRFSSLAATRLWGDRSPWVPGGDRNWPELAICVSSLCSYSFADFVSAEDTAAQGSPADAVPSAGEFP
jgi:hypothetical protein